MNRNAGIALGIIGTAALSFGTYKVIKGIKNRKTMKETKSFGKQTYGTDTATQKINLVETAETIGHALGVDRGWYDPRSWSESDRDAYEALLVVPKPLINKLAEAYSKKFKRNMRTDLNKLLDKEYYDKIKNLLI